MHIQLNINKIQQQFNINANYCVSVRYSYACSKITELLKNIKVDFIQILYQIRLFAAVIDVISACDDGQELFSSRIISNVSPGRSLRVPLGTI